MTMMVHSLYRQDGDKLVTLAELKLPSIHWLVSPTWLKEKPQDMIDWGTLRVRDLSRDDVVRLVGPGPYTLMQRLMTPAFNRIHLAQQKLLEGLSTYDLYAVEWIECY